MLVCSGSGGDFLEDAILGNFGALITADIKHNVFVKAINCGVAVFDAGHYETENIIVKPLCDWLENQFPTLQIIPHSPDLIKSM